MDGESGASNAPRKEEITRLTDGGMRRRLAGIAARSKQIDD